MSAVIFPINFRRAESMDQVVSRRVHEQLHRHVSKMKLSQAQAQAVRSVMFRGLTVDVAVERAVKWALGTDDPEPAPLAA